MLITNLKILILIYSLCFLSCQSEKEKESRLYHESLATEFENKKAGIEDKFETHDSLARVQAYKEDILGQLDSLRLVADSIKAKYLFEAGKLPKKVEFGLMRAEEAANDLKLKIRHSKDAEENWTLFQSQVNKDLEIIKKTLTKL